MVYRDYLNTDPLYQSARKTNQSVHGWDFRPEPKRSPSSFLLVVLAVGMVLIGMAACLAAEVAG